VLSLGASGCSYVWMKSPELRDDNGIQTVSCSSTLVWPIADGVLATTLVFGAQSNLEGAANPSRSNGNPAGMVINFVAAGVAAASLAHGVVKREECRSARESHARTTARRADRPPAHSRAYDRPPSACLD
jgi:hypothetical protein